MHYAHLKILLLSLHFTSISSDSPCLWFEVPADVSFQLFCISELLTSRSQHENPVVCAHEKFPLSARRSRATAQSCGLTTGPVVLPSPNLPSIEDFDRSLGLFCCRSRFLCLVHNSNILSALSFAAGSQFSAKCCLCHPLLLRSLLFLCPLPSHARSD